MTLDQVIQQGIRADQPAATAVPPGTLYSVTDEAYVLERSDGVVWVQYAPAGGGDVTHTGTLTSGKVLIGNGGADLTISSATGIAHLASGALTGADVDLAAEVTGNLPVAHFNGGTNANSATFWRGDGIWVAGLAVIDASTAQVSVSNTVTESSLYAVTVPALSSAGFVRLQMRGLLTQNTGSNRTVQLKVKLGATVMWDATTGTIGSNANQQPWALDLLLGNVAATNSQKTAGWVSVGAFTNGPTTGKGGMDVAVGNQTSQYTSYFYGTAAEDLTSSKTLDIRVILSTNSSSFTITKEMGMAELVAP